MTTVTTVTAVSTLAAFAAFTLVIVLATGGEDRDVRHAATTLGSTVKQFKKTAAPTRCSELRSNRSCVGSTISIRTLAAKMAKRQIDHFLDLLKGEA